MFYQKVTLFHYFNFLAIKYFEGLGFIACNLHYDHHNVSLVDVAYIEVVLSHVRQARVWVGKLTLHFAVLTSLSTLLC